MKPRATTPSILGAALALVSSAAAQDQAKTLTIGDTAPPIDIEHWVQGGDPVSEFKEGRVYVVEFWATWCGPCIMSMPHMSALQEEYKEQADFVGVSDEPLNTVTSWLEKAGRDGKLNSTRATYRLTTDPDKSVYNDYFRAAGQRGIPSAFLVGKTGKIEWIGHPMTIDGPLEAVTEGNWDREAFKVKFEAQAADELVMAQVMAEANPLLAGKEYLSALEVLEAARAKLADPARLQSLIFAIRSGEGLWNQEAVDSLVETLADATSPSSLNSLSWNIAIGKRPADFEDALLNAALDAAQRAVEITESKDPSILDTLARVFYEKGDLAKAIEYQSAAVKLVPENDELGKTLEKYQAEAK